MFQVYLWTFWCANKRSPFLKKPIFGFFFFKIMLESWGCGLYTSAAYTRVFTVICLPTKHLGDLKNFFKCVRAIKIKFECGNVGFWEWENQNTRRKNPLWAKERANNKLNPHKALMPGFEPQLQATLVRRECSASPLLHQNGLKTITNKRQNNIYSKSCNSWYINFFQKP